VVTPDLLEHLSAEDGVLIVDETGFINKGRRSAGVQRHYTGTSKKIDNCQLGVFLACASERGRALIEWELYLPTCWIEDEARRGRMRRSATRSALPPSRRWPAPA
jgi:SRSO17 transposase